MTSVISAAEADRRHLRQSQYVPCTDAFIDCRLPGSMPKENFSMIGPGVTQNAAQVINLTEPHGFNIGAAGIHPGVTNNLHLHFTSETFIAASGAYTLRWGVRGEEGELLVSTGDIVCMPSWIFRGFSSASDDYGFLLTVLGGDDTGGILWSPDVLKRARATGLWLSAENTVIDTHVLGHDPEPSKLMPLLDDSALQDLKRWSVEAMRARVLTKADRDFRPATLDTAAGFSWQIAPAVGFGITQAREHWPRVAEPQGFSVEWIRVGAAQRSAAFSLDEKMVVIAQSVSLIITLNDGDSEITQHLGMNDMVSIPAGVLRSFGCPQGCDEAEAVMIIAGDARKTPKFAPQITDAARQNDVCLDAGGRLAKASLLPPSMLGA